jgi:hypothetical protein
MPVNVLNGPVIEAGESLSAPLDCTGGDVVRITMPSAWTEAVLSFQISTDGEFFNDVFRSDGWEVSFHVVPGSAVLLPPDMTRAVQYLKVRSGTRDNPVPQPERRQFAISVAVEAA